MIKIHLLLLFDLTQDNPWEAAVIYLTMLSVVATL